MALPTISRCSPILAGVNSRNVEHYTGERLVQLHPFQFPGFKLVPFPATQSFHALGADDPQFGVT